MKTLLLAILILFSINVLSQEEEIQTPSQIRTSLQETCIEFGGNEKSFFFEVLTKLGEKRESKNAICYRYKCVVPWTYEDKKDSKKNLPLGEQGNQISVNQVEVLCTDGNIDDEVENKYRKWEAVDKGEKKPLIRIPKIQTIKT